MEDERDADDAIRALDQIEFGRKGRRLRVEWTKQERSSRRTESTKKSSSLRPSKTLFVINFDPYHTRTEDLERHFDPYGKIVNVRIRRNFAFIQYESQEDATKAMEATNLSKLLDRVVTVEYANKDDDERRSGYSLDRNRDRSPRRGYNDRVRSPSPYKRERGSPDYRRGRGERASPDYGHRSTRSPGRNVSDPEYRRGRSPSPRKERGSDFTRKRSPSPRKERDSDFSRKRSPSPRKERDSDFNRKRSPSPRKERDSDFNRKRSPSPRKERDSDFNLKHSPSPQRQRPNGTTGHGPNSGNKLSPDYSHSPNPSPPKEQIERVISPDDYGRDRSPAYSNAESPPPVRYQSRSPPVRERSRS